MSEWGETRDLARPGRQTLARSPLYIFLAMLVLLICLGFTVYFAFLNPHPGFTYDVYWSVSDVINCTDNVTECGSSEDSIKIGDSIVKIGSLSFSEWFVDRSVNPFGGYAVGESIPLRIDRDGRSLEISWRVPPVDAHTKIEATILPVLIYIPFWLVGSVVLLLIRSHGTPWLLFILLNYITALWLAIGLSPSAPPPLAASLVHALSWIMVAVYLHFHLLVPEPIIKKIPKFIIVAFYTLMGILMVLELFKATPVDSYIIAVIVAFIGSFFLVSYQAIRASSGPNKVVSRIMLAGVVLAFIPGLFLWLFPRVIDVESGSLVSIVVPIIAIATFPLFYLYAIYKKNLGTWELRLNRLLYYYTLFLLTFTILSVIFLIGTRWQPPSYDIATMFIIAVAAVLLLFIPFQRRFQHFLDRLAFTSGQSPEELYRRYSTRIPASVDKDALTSLLESEILPNLGIQESAIYLHSGNEIHTLHEFNIPEISRQLSPRELDALLTLDRRYIPPDTRFNASEEYLSWIRLVIPIESNLGVLGAWLVGDRYPDDFYSQNDIQLIDSLADQLGTTLENQQLIDDIKRELAEREQAELQKQQYADRIKMIHQIDQAILAAESTYEIAQAATNRIPELIPCNQACIFIFHHKSEEAELLAVLDSEICLHAIGTRFPISLFNQLLQDFETNSMIRAIYDQKRLANELPKFMTRHTFQSGLLMPLTTPKQMIGIIYIASTEMAAFSSEHEEIASEISNSLAVAMQNRRLISTVDEHRRELQRLSKKLMTAQESERTKISRELHDEIGQLITAIFFNFAAIEKKLDGEKASEIRERLTDTNELIEQLMDGVRSMSLELRPPMLQELGLIPTLRWYIKNSARRLDVTIHYDFNDIECRFSDQVETAVYRIVQEALTNAVRHGQAGEVNVSLVHTNSTLELRFIDDGVGFNPERVFSSDGDDDGAGLLGIRERVSNLGGTVEIRSEPDHGVDIKAAIPLGD